MGPTEPADTESSPADAARARDAALDAWADQALPASTAPDDASDDEPFVPARRTIFPPSFLALLAAACALFALEPTADLGYDLFGPARPTELGRPGAYALDRARDGAYAHIAGSASPVRGTFERWGETYEVVPLIGTAVLVRRAPHPAAAPDTAEPFDGAGRLVALEDTPSTFLERLVRPSARYSTIRMQFESLNELPFGKPAWLLLDGDAPRSHLGTVAKALLLWAGAVAFAFLAGRAHVLRSRRSRLPFPRP